MNDVPDTELFSAYLDGELTADEQVRVEQILAASPDARQLMEELRALDSTLQGLPQEKLDEDVSARVLEIAERRMLLPDGDGNKPSAGRAAETLNSPDADSTGWLGVPWREISWRGMFSRQALIWSGVVVATAIIINFTSPPPPKPNQEVAKHDNSVSPERESGDAVPSTFGKDLAKSSTSDGSWVGPAGTSRKLQLNEELAKGETLAKGERRKAVDAKIRDTETLAESVRSTEKDRYAEEVTPARDRAKDERPGNKLNDKVAEDLAKRDAKSMARPMGGAGANELERSSAPEKYGAERAFRENPRVAEKPSAVAAISAPTDSPAPGTMAYKPPSTPAADKKIGDLKSNVALHDNIEFGTPLPGEKSAGLMPARKMAKEARAKDEPSQAGAAIAERSKVAPSIEGMVANKPAPVAVPLPAAPPASAPSQPGPAIADAPKSVAELSQPAAIVPKSPVVSKTREAQPPSVAEAGQGKGVWEDGDRAAHSVAKSGQTVQLNGVQSPTADGMSSSAGTTVAGNWQYGQTPANRFAGQSAIVIRLDVSALAVQNRVFETLLAHSGLASDQSSANLAQNSPTNNAGLRAGQLEQGGRGGGGSRGMSMQQNLTASNSGMGAGGFQLAPSGSITAGTLNRQQVASQWASRAPSSNVPVVKKDGSSQARTAATDTQLGVGFRAQTDQRDDSKAMIYECDARPEQLATIIKQIGERPDSFSAAESKPAENYSYFSNNSGGGLSGGLGGFGGGIGGSRPGAQEAKAADVSGAKVVPDATTQPQTAPSPAPVAAQQTASPAAGPAKQHVVFVLNKVDRLPLAAGRASPLAAPAAAAPAKQ